MDSCMAKEQNVRRKERGWVQAKSISLQKRSKGRKDHPTVKLHSQQHEKSRTLRSDRLLSEEIVLIVSRNTSLNCAESTTGIKVALISRFHLESSVETKQKRLDLTSSKSPRQLFHGRRNKNSSFSTMIQLDACVQTMFVNYHSRATV